MPRRYQFVVGAQESRQRLDRYLVRHLPQTLSRAAIQRAIRQAAVTVGGQVAKAHRLLKPGETVLARFDQLGALPSRQAHLIPEPIPVEVVYEDGQVLVVNKPPGLVTHPAPGHWSGTLVNAILWHLCETQGARRKTQGNQLESCVSSLESSLPRAGIVHRLDKDTSGLLVVAKTEGALRALAKQLKARTLTRVYVAIVEGHMPHDEGTIEASIGRHPTHRKVMAVRYLGGRQAVTRFRVLKRTRAQEAQGAFPYSILQVSLETGRTHQVRVHLSHVGHPVLGDPVYGKRAPSVWATLGIRRQLLHAYGIRFLHPTRGDAVQVIAPIPSDMAPWMDHCPLEFGAEPERRQARERTPPPVFRP